MAISNANTTGFKVTGPVHHFVQVNTVFSDTTTSSGGGGIFYLGTAEVQPQIKVTKVSIPVKNDLMGRVLPMQNSYQGQYGTIGVALNRFSVDAINAIKSMGAYGIKLGVDYYASIGMLEFSQLTFKLWQVNGNYNFTTPVTGVNAITPGRYWPNVRLTEESDPKIGTIDWTKLLVMEAFKLPTCASGVWTGTLYSEDASDFPTDVKTPAC